MASATQRMAGMAMYDHDLEYTTQHRYICFAMSDKDDVNVDDTQVLSNSQAWRLRGVLL